MVVEELIARLGFEVRGTEKLRRAVVQWNGFRIAIERAIAGLRARLARLNGFLNGFARSISRTTGRIRSAFIGALAATIPASRAAIVGLNRAASAWTLLGRTATTATAQLRRAALVSTGLGVVLGRGLAVAARRVGGEFARMGRGLVNVMRSMRAGVAGFVGIFSYGAGRFLATTKAGWVALGGAIIAVGAALRAIGPAARLAGAALATVTAKARTDLGQFARAKGLNGGTLDALSRALAIRGDGVLADPEKAREQIAKFKETLEEAAQEGGDAAKALAKLKIPLLEGKGKNKKLRDTSAILFDVVRALGQLKDDDARRDVLKDLGIDDTTTVAAILRGLADLQKNLDSVQNSGALATKGQVEASEEWMRNINRIATALKGIGGAFSNEIINSWGPWLRELADNLEGEGGKAWRDWAVEMAKGLQSFQRTASEFGAEIGRFWVNVKSGLGRLNSFLGDGSPFGASFGKFISNTTEELRALNKVLETIGAHLNTIAGAWDRVKGFFGSAAGEKVMPQLKTPAPPTPEPPAKFAPQNDPGGRTKSAPRRLGEPDADDLEETRKAAEKTKTAVADLGATSATPQVDSSSIGTFLAKVAQGIAAMRQLAGMSATAPSALKVDGARAKGGPVGAGRSYLVGERGPELVTPARSGYVHNAQWTAAMLASPSAQFASIERDHQVRRGGGSTYTDARSYDIDVNLPGGSSASDSPASLRRIGNAVLGAVSTKGSNTATAALTAP